MNTYAICQLSVVPVRHEPSERSEMVTQIVFGEFANIITVEERWLFVELLHDTYRGWVDRKMLFELSNAEYEHLSCEPYKLVSNPLQQIETSAGNLIVPMGSSLRANQVLNYNTLPQTHIFKCNELVTKAKELLNAPYLWGGRTIFGIDCSGFVQLLYRLAGKNIPRDASQQIDMGTPVSPECTVAGDLAFFGDADKITHVGMVMGDGKLIHASGCVRIDTLDDKGIYNSSTATYTHKLKEIKRLV